MRTLSIISIIIFLSALILELLLAQLSDNVEFVVFILLLSLIYGFCYSIVGLAKMKTMKAMSIIGIIIFVCVFAYIMYIVWVVADNKLTLSKSGEYQLLYGLFLSFLYGAIYSVVTIVNLK